MHSPNRLAGIAVQRIAVVLALNEIGDTVAIYVGKMCGTTSSVQPRRQWTHAERERARDPGVNYLELVIWLSEEWRFAE